MCNKLKACVRMSLIMDDYRSTSFQTLYSLKSVNELISETLPLSLRLVTLKVNVCTLLFCRHLVTSYNRGYAFSPIKTRLSQPPSSPVKENNPVTASGPPAMMFNPRGRYHSEPLLALNHENVSERLNHSMDHTDAKAAFKLLETAG